MTVYAAPGATFEANVSGATTGQSGTIGVRISNLVTDTDFLARTTAGIQEYPASSGIYSRSFTAPTTAATYSIIWDVGGVFATEDLVVTSSSPGGSTPSGADLCTLANVRAFIQKEATDTAQDPVISTLITSVSTQIIEWCCREFAPASTAATRRVKCDSTLVDLAPYDLRTATAVVLSPESASPVTLAATDYMLEPLNGATGGTYLHLRLSTALSLYSTTWQNFGYALVDVTGDWGFATIPEDVKQACIEAVAVRLRRDVAAFSTTFNLDESRMERPESLPASVCQALRQYKRMVV